MRNSHAVAPPDESARKAALRAGFTLIELSIVLVIVGLVVGGVLVGRDLISAAEVRAQITQIEKFNQAVNTFYGKYQALPGDMNGPTAAQYGFAVGTNCTGGIGGRDGNGLIDSYWDTFPGQYPGAMTGENLLFWEDLTTANMIEGQFPSVGTAVACTQVPGALSSTPGATFVGNYLPAAKLGKSNYIAVYDSGGSNWYSLQVISATNATSTIVGYGTNIPVMQAYKIDQKVDDGYPTTGNVVAVYLASNPAVPAPNAASDSATTCYNTTSPAYSIGFNNGAGGNCGLSFRFQ